MRSSHLEILPNDTVILFLYPFPISIPIRMRTSCPLVSYGKGNFKLSKKCINFYMSKTEISSSPLPYQLAKSTAFPVYEAS